MKINAITRPCIYGLAVLILISAAVGCTDEALLSHPASEMGSVRLGTTTTSAVAEVQCGACDYIVPAGQQVIDGAVLGLKPGAVIGLSAHTQYSNLTFKNIVGTPDQPIIIKNCGGQATIDGTGAGFSIKTSNSRYFRITGGNTDGVYGIIVKGGHMGVNLGGLSTNFEVDHLEIMNSGFAGIMAKTDPNCNDATIRGNFLMEKVYLHHNYIHDTGGEGIYAGNSWYSGMNTDCGMRLPHEIHDIAIHHNIVMNSGWEAIQLGCATQGASIYNNIVENYGLVNKKSQNNGIQVGSGTGGLCYNNLIRKGTGNGLIVMGLGDNIIYNNIIDQAGNFGIFCDERESPGPGFVFLHNTILNPGSDGIRIYAELVPKNVIVNNIIANPGSYSQYVYPRSSEDAFIYRLNNKVNIETAGNYFTNHTDSLKILNLPLFQYAMDIKSPVIDKGTDITPYCNFITDFYGNPRMMNGSYDIGAIETPVANSAPPNTAPIADAGPNLTISLPDNTVQLKGKGTDSDGSIESYRWTQYGGPEVTIINAQSATASVSGLVEGKYYFRLTVKDDRQATHTDNMLVRVEPGSGVANIAPVANAGPNRTVTLPQTSLTLNGYGSDSDGIIQNYQWTQYGGVPAIITDATSAKPTISGLTAGKYYFRLTVTDNDGAMHYDNMLVRVAP